MSLTANKLIELAARRFGAEPGQLSPEDDMFETLGIDSFQAADLMSDIELEFDVEIPDYELQGIRTFRSLADKIDKRR